MQREMNMIHHNHLLLLIRLFLRRLLLRVIPHKEIRNRNTKIKSFFLSRQKRDKWKQIMEIKGYLRNMGNNQNHQRIIMIRRVRIVMMKMKIKRDWCLKKIMNWTQVPALFSFRKNLENKIKSNLLKSQLNRSW